MRLFEALIAAKDEPQVVELTEADYAALYITKEQLIRDGYKFTFPGDASPPAPCVAFGVKPCRDCSSYRDRRVFISKDEE